MAATFISGGSGDDSLIGGTRSLGGTAKSRGLGKVDPRLVQIIDAAAARSPYDVQIFSGIRQGSAGGSRHNTGNAIDIALIDPATGQVVPNYKSSTGFPIYAEFAKVAREEQMRVAPDMADQFRWGGGFSDKDFDLMHFDFKPGGAMAYWTWQDGGKLTAAGAEAVPKFGAGYVYANGERYKAPQGQYVSLWGRDPLQATQAPTINMASVSPTTAKLAGVMLAEARGEGRDGMTGVGNVVLNRTNTPGARFPKTIDEVINGEFAKPLGPGDVSPEQWQEAVEIAMGLQAGVIPDNTGGAVYFANPETSQTSAYNLIKASGPVTATIGNHVYHAGSAPPTPRASPVANIVQAREASQPNMAARPPTTVAPPPVMTPTPPPFTLEGGASTSQGAAAMATGTMPPAVPQPRMRPGGANVSVAPPPTMVSTPPPFQLSGGASTSQGGASSAVGTLPPAVPSPRPRPDNNYFDVDEATRIDDMGNYVGSGQSPGVPDPSQRPNMSVAPPPSPTKASEPAVRPIPASMAVEAPPAPPEKREPAGVSFISPASIPNLAPAPPPADLKAGEASESITSPMSVIEAAIQDFDSATPSQAAAPSMPSPAATMRPPTPAAQAAPTNMATSPPASGATIQTTQAPSMATASPGGGWFSKLFTPNTGGSKGFSPSGGGVSPSGLTYRTGTGLGGNPAFQWTNSKGQTVTVVENGFGQPGYSTGFG